MLITNCLSSQRINIVINPGLDKFIAHINVPVWPSNKYLTFLMSIITLKTKGEIKINKIKSQKAHDITITSRIGTTLNILWCLGFDHDPQPQLSVLQGSHCFYQVRFSAAQKKHFSQKKMMETLICKEISWDCTIHAVLAKFQSKQCIPIYNLWANQELLGETLLCIAIGLHSMEVNIIH